MFSFNISLSKNESVVSMHSSIGNPIFLRGNSRTVNHKLLGLVIIMSSSFHLDGVVTVSKLGKTKTASNIKTVDLVKYPFMPICVKSYNRTA